MVRELLFQTETWLNGDVLFYDFAFFVMESVDDFAEVVEVIERCAAQSVENNAPYANRKFKSEISPPIARNPSGIFVGVAEFALGDTLVTPFKRFEVDMVKLKTNIDFLLVGGVDENVFADGVMTVVSVGFVVHAKHVDKLFVGVIAVDERCFCANVLRKIVLVIKCCGGIAPMHCSHVIFHDHVVASTEKHDVESAVFVRFCSNFGVDIVEIDGVVLPLFGWFEEYLKICAPCGKEKRGFVFHDWTVNGKFRRKKPD